MSLNRPNLANLAALGYFSVLVGIAAGVSGYVKFGAGAISLGAGLVSYSHSGATRIERYLPLALAVCLMVMAIALPGRR